MAVVAADVMDMGKAECSTSRILPARHPRYRDNNTDAFAKFPHLFPEVPFLFAFPMSQLILAQRGELS